MNIVFRENNSRVLNILHFYKEIYVIKMDINILPYTIINILGD